MAFFKEYFIRQTAHVHSFTAVPIMIVLAAATRQELSCLTEQVPLLPCPGIPGLPVFTCSLHNREFLLLRTGVGLKKAGAAGRRLLQYCTPSAVISIGAAGAADPALSVGNLILAEKILHYQSRSCFRVDEELSNSIARKLSMAGIPVVRGSCCSVSTFIHSVDEKKTIFAQSRASVIDMESAALARGCTSAAIPFISIRIVSDSAQADVFNINAFYAGKKKSGRIGAWKYFAQNPPELVRALKLKRALDLVSRQVAAVTHALFRNGGIKCAKDMP